MHYTCNKIKLAYATYIHTDIFLRVNNWCKERLMKLWKNEWTDFDT